MTNTDADGAPDEGVLRTGTGDDGTSGLLGGVRRSKDDPVFEALGTVDEAQVALGLCRALVTASPSAQETSLSSDLLWVQQQLLRAGAGIACPSAAPRPSTLDILTESQVSDILSCFEGWRTMVTLPSVFVVSGDTLLGARLDWARTVLRRAERRVVGLGSRTEGLKATVRFLNVAGDLLYLWARWADQNPPGRPRSPVS